MPNHEKKGDQGIVKNLTILNKLKTKYTGEMKWGRFPCD